MRRFSSFSLDAANQCIWRAQARVQLTPKTFGVLQYLVEHPGRIVTKQELLDAIWPETFVQEAVLKTCILDIRKALDDNPKAPRYIATVHRRGYRFNDSAAETEPPAREPREHIPGLVGREEALGRLQALRQRAADGCRQVVFITGEPGLGKSTLISHFVSEVRRAGPDPVLGARCIQHFAASEAYYPILDALTRGVRDEAVPTLAEVLRRHAPAWLVQMPGLTSPEERRVLKQETLGATRQCMLREMSEALEALVANQTLLLILEDLQWSDISTIDLISWIASRNEPARLLLIASYRPEDAVINSHPVRLVKQNLLANGRCVEIELELLKPVHVDAILQERFPEHQLPKDFAQKVYARTEGNPLFVHNVLDYALGTSLIEEEGAWKLKADTRHGDLSLPESLSRAMEMQVERLTNEEQTLLERASVAGVNFATALIASEHPGEADSAEACCEQLARRGLFIRSAGSTGPIDRAATGRYQFAHSLYRDVFYRRLSPATRMRLHQSIGERLERASCNCLSDMAAELSMHFQESRDYARAILYLRLAAQRCAGRQAIHEAVESLTRGLALAEQLGEPERSTVKLDLTEQLGLAYRLSGQLACSIREFENMNDLALALQITEPQLRAQLWLAGVTSFSDRTRCLEAASAAVNLCGKCVDENLRSNALGQAAYWNLLFCGWDENDTFASAAALESAKRNCDSAALALHTSRHSFFRGLASRYREACQTARQGIRIATQIGSLLDYSISHYYEAWALLHLGEWGDMQRLLTAAIDRAHRNGHPLWVLLFGLLQSFLQIQAFSFDLASKHCQEQLDRAHALQHPLSVQVSCILLGMARLGAGDLEGAQRSFDEIRQRQSRERILMDWIWRLPLGLGLTELQLAFGKVESARKEAEWFTSAALATAERTWIALARYARARVAFADGNTSLMLAEVEWGLKAIAGFEAPLAEWRLHALASMARADGAHRENAQSTIWRIANSLPDSDPLRASFLASAGSQLGRQPN